MFMSLYDILRRYFVSGVLVVVPVILTYIVLKFLFEAIDGLLQPLLFQVLGYFLPGLGVVTTLLLILLAGILTRNYFGSRLYRLGDSLLARLPITRPIYSAAKQLLEAMTSSSGQAFKEVALVEYPRRGARALCFVSRYLKIQTDSGEQDMVAVFVPSTPTPVSGTVIVVPKDDIMILDMTVEDGIKFLVSGGVASPDLLRSRPPGPRTTGREVLNETR